MVAAMWRFAIGTALALAVLIAGLIQPERTYPPEVKVPLRQKITLSPLPEPAGVGLHADDNG